MAGKYHSGQGVDGFGQECRYEGKMRDAPIGGVRAGEESAKQQTTDGNRQSLVRRQRSSREKAHHSQSYSADHATHEDVGGSYFQVRLFEEWLQVRNPGGTAEQGVERRNLAQHFVAQQGELLAGSTRRGLLYCCQTFAQKASLGTALV